MKHAATFAAALIAAALAAPAALAEDSIRQNVSVEVEHGDLNLHSEAGAERMLNRIERAARRACGVVPSRRVDLDTFNQGRACVADATEQAVAALDAPLVRSMYAARQGETEYPQGGSVSRARMRQ